MTRTPDDSMLPSRQPEGPSFRQVAQAQPYITYVLQRSGAVEATNARWAAHTGRNDASLTQACEAIHPDDRASLWASWQQARDSDSTLDARLRLRGRTGAYRWFHTQAVPVLDPNQGGLCWYGSCIDIDDEVRAHEAAAEVDRRRDAFLATLAHELRNPLSPIRNAAQVLRAPGVDAAQQAWAIDIITRQVGVMRSLLEALLEVSRITVGTLTLKKDLVAVRGVVDAAVELARPIIDQRRHTLSVSGDALDTMLDADALRLMQALGNLLDNAARYTEPGGDITVSANTLPGRVELAVHDTGIGMAADDLDGVFDKFSPLRGRASAAPRPAVAAAAPSGSNGPWDAGSGLGIGLAFAKGLVELHGGSVSASSPGLGRGSVFRIVLPLGGAVAKPLPATAAPYATTAGGALQVLVVDDNRDCADSMAALLHSAGHRVDVAYDGPTALAKAAQRPPDVALIDIGMPHVDGCEVARRIRGEPWGEHAYLIAATGWGQAEDKLITQASGFDRHLVKPLNPDQVLQMLADCGVRRPTPNMASPAVAQAASERR
jgi:signal transduction histidine kinase/ActR/RegA family two-component response regulator